jgi:PPE-repeat protein
MDFSTRPPEITSGRIYSGPGSGSMMAVAATWDRLATTLDGFAAECRSMPQPAKSYLEWLRATAIEARQAATQAQAAAIAYESAFAEVVPPLVIEANRAQRMELATTNHLAHAGPAIADAEAEYDQMWAQDTAAMHAYAGASAAASALTPFASPPACQAALPAKAPWALASAPDVISAGCQVTSAIPHALKALSSSPEATFDASLFPVTAALSKLSSLSAPLDFAIGHLSSLNRAAALRSLLPGCSGGTAYTARLGRAASIGMVSVPPTWTVPTPHPTAAEVRRARLVEVNHRYSGVT